MRPCVVLPSFGTLLCNNFCVDMACPLFLEGAAERHVSKEGEMGQKLEDLRGANTDGHVNYRLKPVLLRGALCDAGEDGSSCGGPRDGPAGPDCHTGG